VQGISTGKCGIEKFRQEKIMEGLIPWRSRIWHRNVKVPRREILTLRGLECV
jgi:hypothetical protein